MKNNWLRKFIERVDSQTDQELFNDLQAAGYTLEQLRAALAVALFGYKRYTVPPDCDGINSTVILVPSDFDEHTYMFPPRGRLAFTFCVRKYSTTNDGVAAVLKRMEELDWSYYLGNFPDGHKAIFYRINKQGRMDVVGNAVAAPTLSEAIAKAALDALEKEADKKEEVYYDRTRAAGIKS